MVLTSDREGIRVRRRLRAAGEEASEDHFSLGAVHWDVVVGDSFKEDRTEQMPSNSTNAKERE